MEHIIGELGQSIWQPSNMFGNLIQVTIKKVQLNALKSISPELDRTVRFSDCSDQTL